MTSHYGAQHQVKMHTKQKMTRCCRSCLDISAEVINCHIFSVQDKEIRVSHKFMANVR